VFESKLIQKSRYVEVINKLDRILHGKPSAPLPEG